MSEEDKIDANPTKDFFISMLTRDIDLPPALLELVDNSMDGARKLRKQGFKQLCSIKMNYSRDEFRIEDTCGGISIYDAKNYCFTFGRKKDQIKDEEERQAKTIGVFGIGMKRALFKLGKKFIIKSVTLNESFIVEVNVDDWLRDLNPDWTFDFTETYTGLNNKINECGTFILVTELHSSISNFFSRPSFNDAFLKYLRSRIGALKELNIELEVQNDKLEYIDEKIICDDLMKPYTYNEILDEVSVRIIAGCANMGTPDKAGWYIFCNSRMIIGADQSEISGWGTDGVPKFHRGEHAAFRGYVFFESEIVNKLPWNTTKTGVDLSSQVYLAVLQKMRIATKEFVAFKNKVNDATSSTEALTAESIFNSRAEVSIFSSQIKEYAALSRGSVFPTVFKEPEQPMTTVNFKICKNKADLAKERLNVRSNSALGIKLFDYYYKREISDDEQ